MRLMNVRCVSPSTRVWVEARAPVGLDQGVGRPVAKTAGTGPRGAGADASVERAAITAAGSGACRAGTTMMGRAGASTIEREEAGRHHSCGHAWVVMTTYGSVCAASPHGALANDVRRGAGAGAAIGAAIAAEAVPRGGAAQPATRVPPGRRARSVSGGAITSRPVARSSTRNTFIPSRDSHIWWSAVG
jgi:hypothetical protein